MCGLWLRWCVLSFAERGEGACACVFSAVLVFECSVVALLFAHPVPGGASAADGNYTGPSSAAVPLLRKRRYKQSQRASHHGTVLDGMPAFMHAVRRLRLPQVAASAVPSTMWWWLYVAGVAGHTQPCVVHRNVPRLRYSCGLVSHGSQLRGGEARQRYRSRGVTNSHQNWVVKYTHVHPFACLAAAPIP